MKPAWWGLAPAMTIPAIASYVYFFGAPKSNYAQVLYGLAKLFILIWPVVAVCFIQKKRFSFLRAIRFRKPIVSVMGLVTGTIMATIMLGIYFIPAVHEYVQPFGANVQSKINEFGIADHYILFALVMSIVHAFLEEYYWRWFVFGTLRSLVSPIVAYGLAGLAFAAHHFVILYAFVPLGLTIVFGLGVMGAGMVWCYHYQKRGTIIGAWISHILADLAIFSIGYDLIAH